MITTHTAAQPQRSAADPREQSATTSRHQAVRVAWFAGLGVALGTAATLAIVSLSFLPLILAIAPIVAALALEWRDRSIRRDGQSDQSAARDASGAPELPVVAGNRSFDLVIGPRR